VQTTALDRIYETCSFGSNAHELLRAHGIKFLVRIATQQWPDNGDLDSSSSEYDQIVQQAPGRQRSMRRMALCCLAEMVNYDPLLQVRRRPCHAMPCHNMHGQCMMLGCTA
jgi:hypothetical protein